jgi:hypothetical protein
LILQKNFGPGFVRGFVVLLGFSGVFWGKWCFVVVFLWTECGGLRGNRDMGTAGCGGVEILQFLKIFLWK